MQLTLTCSLQARHNDLTTAAHTRKEEFHAPQDVFRTKGSIFEFCKKHIAESEVGYETTPPSRKYKSGDKRPTSERLQLPKPKRMSFGGRSRFALLQDFGRSENGIDGSDDEAD